MESERERLLRMYGELSEEHLRDLEKDPDSLTDEARMALRQVLVARGLKPAPVADATLPVEEGQELEAGFSAGIPGVFPSSAAVVERALEPGGAEARGMVNLVTFFDGHELTRACAALEDADIEPVLQPLDRDAQSGAPPSFGIWVAVDDHDLAQRVLRQKMGLFPFAEVDDHDDGAADDEWMTLGDFETAAEAFEVRGVLTAAGIAVEDASPDQAEPGDWHAVRVRASDFERGLAVVSESLKIN